MRDILKELWVADAVLHHGDCMGKDAMAHLIALEVGYRVVVHPPDIEFFRAHCRGDGVEIRPVRPYLMRNGDIVKESNVLVAVPDGPPKARSGTWYTVRKAHAVNIPVHVYSQHSTGRMH